MRIRQEGQCSRPLGRCCFPHRKECWTPREGVRHIHWRLLESRRMKEHRIRPVYCQNLTIEQLAISVTTYRRRHSIAAGRCAVLAAARTTPLSARLYALGLSAPGSAISLVSAVATSAMGSSVDSAHKGHHRERVSHFALDGDFLFVSKLIKSEVRN